jgi:hypothetical protein
VIGQAGVTCTGEYFGGIRSSAASHDVWIIRCDGIADAQRMLDSLRPQMSTLGATPTDSGSNTAPSGDAEFYFEFTRDAASGYVRLTVLEAEHEHTMVLTIDANS